MIKKLLNHIKGTGAKLNDYPKEESFPTEESSPTPLFVTQWEEFADKHKNMKHFSLYGVDMMVDAIVRKIHPINYRNVICDERETVVIRAIYVDKVGVIHCYQVSIYEALNHLTDIR